MSVFSLKTISKWWTLVETFVQNVKDFQAKFEYLKKFILGGQFSKIHFLSISILVIISHPHFLIGSYHLSSVLLQNKAIIVGFSRI